MGVPTDLAFRIDHRIAAYQRLMKGARKPGRGRDELNLYFRLIILLVLAQLWIFKKVVVKRLNLDFFIWV